MKINIIFVTFFIFLLTLGCSKPKESDSYAKKELSKINKETIILIQEILQKETLVDITQLGMGNIVFSIFKDSLKNYNETEKYIFAQLARSRGFYFLGLDVIQKANFPNKFQNAYYKFNDAVSTFDFILSQKYLNEMETLIHKEKSINSLVILHLSRGYLQHNKGEYPAAIRNFETCINLCNKHHLDTLKANIYRKIGNSYNDLARINYGEKKYIEHYIQKALYNYNKEKEHNDKYLKSIYKTNGLIDVVIALMYERINRNPLDFIANAYQKLIFYSDSAIILNSNASATSLMQLIAFDHYAKQNSLENSKILDSIYKKHHTLTGNNTLTSFCSDYGLETKVYNHQNIIENYIIYKLKDTFSLNKSLHILNLSNSEKYPYIIKLQQIKEIFKENYTDAIRCYLQLQEIKAYSIIKGNKELERKSIQLLNRLNHIGRHRFISNSNKVITNKDIIKLQDYCKINNTSIIDYQLTNKGITITTIINSKGFNQSLDTGRIHSIQYYIDSLKFYAEHDQIIPYKKLADTIYRTLKLDQIKTKNIIICGDELLEQIPFDGLIYKKSASNRWKDQHFLIKKQNIQLIPSLSFLTYHMNSTKDIIPLKVDLYNNSKDGISLPFNKNLEKWMRENLEVSHNIKKDKYQAILHLLGHTKENEKKEKTYFMDSTSFNLKSKINVPPKLCILHGCESNHGKLYKSEGIISLSRMFFYNGAEAVISSTWDLDNQSSVELFKYFYKNLDPKTSSLIALKKSKKEVINDPIRVEWANPKYWAFINYYGVDLTFD
jgi:CHAT domain-containing protein